MAINSATASIDDDRDQPINRADDATTPVSNAFLRLPAEIIILIAESLDVGDQLSLGLTSRRLHRVVNPIIYETDIKSGRSYCLFWAVQKGQKGALEQALACGAHLDTRRLDEKTVIPTPLRDLRHPVQYRTPLHWAVLFRKLDVVEWLLDHGANPDAPSHAVRLVPPVTELATGATAFSSSFSSSFSSTFSNPPLIRLSRPLDSALRLGELSIARTLIRRGASNMADLEPGRESTALHCAASSGFASVIELLHSTPDFDVDGLDSSGHTALHLVARIRAAPDGDVSVRATAAALLSVGANVEAPNTHGTTPLLFSCQEGSFVLARELLKAKANPHVRTPTADWPLFYCVRRMHHFPRWEAWDPNHDARDEFDNQAVALIRSLLAAGLDVDCRTRCDGLTPLMMACQEAGPRIIQTLLDLGASVTATDHSGRTPLVHVFAIPGMVDTAIIELLVRNGARLDAKAEGFSSPLELAIDSSWGKSSRSLESMLAHAGPANVALDELQAALEKCISDVFPEPMELLLAFQERVFGIPKGQINDLIEKTIKHHDQPTHVQTFNILMQFAKHDPDTTDSAELLLLKSIEAHNSFITLAILDRGNLSDGGCAAVRLPNNDTFLHLACRWGEPAVIPALLANTTDINVFNDDLQTPLSLAVIENFSRVASCLVDEGADPHLLPPEELLRELHGDYDGYGSTNTNTNHDGSNKNKNNNTNGNTNGHANGYGSSDDGVPHNHALLTYNHLPTAFDLAIQLDRVSMLQDMLHRFPLPPLPRASRDTYLHRAGRKANPIILEMLLSRGADPSGGPECPDPPARSLLRRMWSRPRPADLASSCLDAVKLLMDADAERKGRGGDFAGAKDILEEIIRYEGDDENRVKLSQITKQKLKVGSKDGVASYYD